MIQHSIHIQNHLKSQLHFNCPGCGRKLDIERQVVYEIGDVETQQVKDIYSLDIYDHKCEFCGKRFNARHNFTLIRNSREEDVNFILHFMSDTDMDKAERLFRNHLVTLYYDNDMLIDIDEVGNFINAGYPCRIVRSRLEFGEKSFIFEDKLDDRVIEVLKLKVRNQFAREYPQSRVNALYYNQTKDNQIIWRVITDNGSCDYASDAADYRVAKQVVTYSLKYWNSNCMFIIDEFFGMTMVEIYNRHKNNSPAGYAEIRLKSKVVREADDIHARMERERQRRLQIALSRNHQAGASGYGYSGESGGDNGNGYSAGETEYNQPSSYPETTGGYSYLGDRYNYENAMNEGGSGGYNTAVSSNDTPQYFAGEYRPYNESGETTEVYHYDDGSVPMDY